MDVYFTAVRRFDPSIGDEWNRFVEWTRLFHLREVISLDGILCPSFFTDLIDDDWKHNVQEDFKLDLMRDLDHVLRRIKRVDGLSVLAVAQEPVPGELSQFCDSQFLFRGFDLIEAKGGGTSALVGCGGFDKAFAASDLSESGLITEHAKAIEVQTRLLDEYPTEHHADTDVWAIWQLVNVKH